MSEETTVIEDAEILSEETALVAADEAEQETSVAVQFEDNDAILLANITLPTEDDITDKKIDDALKASFDNFTFDENADMSMQFDNLDDAIDYSRRSMEDIRKRQNRKDAQNRSNNATILARFWCTCKTWADIASKSKKYGSGTVQKLAAGLGFSQSYMYSWILVGKKITKRDAYLLGMRDVGTKVLRDIAAIKEDDARRAAIREFCENYRETANIKEREEAKRKLVLACGLGNKKDSFEGDLTANPGSDDSDYTEEVDNILKALTCVKNMVDKLTNDETTNTFKAYAGNYFMLSTTEGAETQHQLVMEKAKAVRDLCTKAEDNLATICQELDSLLAASIVDPE